MKYVLGGSSPSSRDTIREGGLVTVVDLIVHESLFGGCVTYQL